MRVENSTWSQGPQQRREDKHGITPRARKHAHTASHPTDRMHNRCTCSTTHTNRGWLKVAALRRSCRLWVSPDPSELPLSVIIAALSSITCCPSLQHLTLVRKRVKLCMLPRGFCGMRLRDQAHCTSSGAALTALQQWLAIGKSTAAATAASTV